MANNDFEQSVLGAPDSKINPATGLQGNVKSPVLSSSDSFKELITSGGGNPLMSGGSEINLDPNKFSFQPKSGADNVELRAQDQPFLEQTLYGAGRLIGTTATKTIEGLGYLWGMGAALVSDVVGPHKSLAESLDNGWTNFWGNAEESLKEAMPIYHTKKYDQGNILQQMGTWGFWMDDMIDGIAFLASAAIGSKGISAAGKATGAYGKLAKAWSKATKMARLGKVSTNAVMPLERIVAGMDMTTMTAFNSFVEAGFETKDTMDTLMKQGMSKEDAAKAAQGTFWWNVGILMVPNYITNKLLFGKPSITTGRIKNITGPKGELISEVTPLTKAQKIGAFAKGSAESVISEGPWEENIQLAIQNYFQDKATGKEKRNQFEGVFSNWAHNWTTDEGIKSIALGSLIGLIPGGVGGYRQAKAEKKNEVALHAMLGHTMATVSKDLDKKDPWLRDENGVVQKDPDTGEPIPSPYKLALMFVLSHATTQNAMQTLQATKEGNKLMLDRLSEERVASLAFAHLGSEDGIETFEAEMKAYAKQEIESKLAEGETADEKAIKELADKYIQKGKQYQVLFNNVHQAFAGLYNFQERTGDKQKDLHLFNIANQVKDTALLNQFMASVDQVFWIEKGKALESEIAKLTSSTIGETELGKAKIEELQKLVEVTKEQVSLSEKNVKELLKESHWKTKYEDEKKAVIAELDSQNNTPPSTTTKKEEDEFITVKDKNNNEYIFQGKDKEGKLILVNKKTGKEETFTPEEAAAVNIVTTGEKAIPIAEHLEALDKEIADRGTITPPKRTVAEEVQAKQAEFEAKAENEAASERRKESIIEELSRKSRIEITGTETEEELISKITTAIILDKYGDDKAAEGTLSELFRGVVPGQAVDVVYRDEQGILFIDQKTNEVVFRSLETGKEYIIGKTTDSELYAGTTTVADLGIIPIKHTIFNIELDTDGVGIIVQGRRYVMDNEDPRSFIEEDETGYPIAVTLKDVNGTPLRFTNPTLVEELAYSIELLTVARETAYKQYLNDLDSDFIVVRDPRRADDAQKYYIYYQPDGSKDVVRPVVTGEGSTARINYVRVTNPRFRQILIDAHMKDMSTLMERIVAEKVSAHNRETEESKAESKKKIKDEIKEFIGNTRSAVAKEIIDGPGITEVSNLKAAENKGKPGKNVDKTTARTDTTQPGGEGSSSEAAATGTEVQIEEHELVEEKADELAKTKKGKKKSTKNKKNEDEGIEPSNDALEEEAPEKKELNDRRSTSNPETGVAWKAEDNQELDKLLSDPNNNLEGYKLVVTFDTSYEDSDWKKGSEISVESMSKTYRTRYNKEDYNAPIDNVPLKLTLVGPKGEEIAVKGMFLHKSKFAEEATIALTEEEKRLLSIGDIANYDKSREKTIEAARAATRLQRRAVVTDLLAKKNVELTGLKKGSGIMNQTRGNNRNLLEITESADNGTLVIADRQETLWDGKGNVVAGRAASGNVLWVTTETANKSPRNIKLNVSKISEEHANILLKAFQQMVNSKGGPNTRYEGTEVTGELTVGEVIDYLVLEGDIANYGHNRNTDKNLLFLEHMVPKTLYTDGKVLYFGDDSLNLGKKLTKEQVQNFVNHVTKHKNYIVPLKTSTNSKTGTGIGGKIEKAFTIGSIKASKGQSYQSFLIMNGMVQTDAIRDTATGRVFSKPMFYFDPYGIKKTKASDKTPAKETPKKNEVVKEEKRASKAVVTQETGDIKELKAKDISSLPEGTDVFLGVKGAQALNDDDTVAAGDANAWSYIDVVFKVVRNEAGQLVLQLKTSDKKNKAAFEQFDGMELSHTSVNKMATAGPKQYALYAELPKQDTAEKADVLGKLTEEDLNDLDAIDGKKGPVYPHLVTGGPYEAGDLQAAIKNLRKKLGPKVTIKTEEDLIRVITEAGNEQAFGTFQRDAITLSKKLAKATEYEEAFHRVSLLYLTAAQQQEIYKEARVRYKIPEASDREVNERLAEEYREMESRGEKVQGPKTLVGRIKQFFTDLFDFLSTIVTGGKLRISNLDVNNLFRVMGKSNGRTGRLWYARARKSSYELLKQGDVYNHIVKGRDLPHVKSVAQLTQITNHLVYTILNHSGVFQTKDISSIKYMSGRDAMIGYVEYARKKGNTELADFYQEIVDNYSIYLDLMKSQIEALGIRTILPENPEDENDTRGDNFKRYDKASFELAGRDNAGAAIKLVIATLKATEERDADTLLNKFVDYDAMFDTLLNDLSEMSTVEEMVKHLKRQKTAPYKDLVSKLEADRATDPFDTLHTQFFHAMRKNRYKYRNVLATKKEDKFNLDVADAETQKVSGAQNTVWGQAFLLSKAYEGGKVNKEYLSGVLQDFSKLSIQVKKEFTAEKNKHTLPNFNQIFNDTIKLFNKVSIPLDREVLNNILTRTDPSDKHNALYHFLVSSKTGPVFGSTGTFAKLMSKGKVTNNKGIEIQLDHLFTNEQLFRDLIAPAYLEVHGGLTTNAILGPDGNPYYLLSENSYVTDLFHALRTNPDFGVSYNQLAGVDYNEHSHLLKQLADPDVRKKLEVVMFSALSLVRTRDRGRSYSDITDLEDTLVKMGLFEAGLIVMPQLADRGHLYTMAGLNPLKWNYIFNEKTGELTIPQSITDIFYYYAVDEYKQIQKVKNEIDSALKNNTEHLLKENYHFVYDEDGERDYKNANGLKYQHFTEFNGKNYVLDPEKISDTQLSTYKNLVTKVLKDRINDSLMDMSKQGIVHVVKGKNGQIVAVNNRLIGSDSLKKASKEFGGNIEITLRNKIANFTLNSIMATIESEKIVFMSPAYYKNLDDKIKRYTAIASTGTVSRLGIPETILSNDRLLHNNDNFVSSVLSTQKYDAKQVREILTPRFANSYEKQGYTKEAALARAVRVLDKFTSVDPTDGQAYITPDMFRALSIRLGEWTMTKQDAFDLMMEERDLTVKEQQIVDDLFMQPLKFGYFGPQLTPNSASPLYYKMSLATLTPRLVKGTQLEELYRAMTSKTNPIDMVLFDSAVKVGVGNKTPFYAANADGSPNTDLINVVDIANMPTNEASFQYLRRQTITDPHNELRDTVKTQFRKIALSNIDDNRIYKVDGKEQTGKELKENNKLLMEELSDRGTDEFLKIIGIDNESLLPQDPDKLYEFIRTKARMSGMPDSLVDALAKQIDGEQYESDSLPDRKWIQSAMIASLAKKSVDIHLPGTALIQMTNFGLRNWEEDDSLKLIDDEGMMEAKVSIEIFRNAIPGYSSKTYAERLEYANAMFVGIGYRVPTQGLVSTVPLKIVGFLPETSTATVILPSEFTTLTGSDFDIDKLYFVRHNYEVTELGPNKVEYLTDDNSTVDERLDKFSYEAIASEVKEKKKAWLTSLQETFGKRSELKALLSELRDEVDSTMTDEMDVDTKSPEYIQMLEKQRKVTSLTIENLTKEIADQKKEIDAWVENRRQDWKSDNMREFMMERSIMQQNTKAALENRLIDSYFAVLQSNDHITDNYLPLDQTVELLRDLAKNVNKLEGTSRNYPSLYTASYLYQKEVKHKYLWGKKGIGPFARANVHHILGQIAGIRLNGYLGVGNQVEVDGRIYTDLSQVNGKDNEPILDWLSALITAHVDIAKDAYIFALNVNNATYSVGELLVRAGVGEQSFLFLAQPVLKEYAQAHSDYRGKIRATNIKPLTLIRNRYKNLLEKARKAEELKQAPTSESEIFDNTRLERDINSKTVKNAAFYARQLQVLDKFSEINEYGKYLFEAVEATTVDTKRFGNNLAELRRFNRLVNKVLKDKVIVNMDKLFDMTFIGTYYENSVILGQSIFKDTTVMASDSVTALLDRIMTEIGRGEDISKEGVWFLNHINDEIYAGIVGAFMTNDMGVTGAKLEEMLYGDHSMVARLNSIKNNSKYSDNPLIKLLQPSMSFKKGQPDLIITFTATDVKTKWAKDRIIDGWSELITSNNEDIAAFGRDLVTYSFFTSGFKKSIYSIYNFIPPSYLKSIGFSTYMKNMRNQFNDINNYSLLEGVHDEVFQNSWDDDAMVPRVMHSDFGEKRVPPKSSGWDVDYPMQVSIRGKKAQEEIALGYNIYGQVIYRPFIKAMVSNTWQLYKFVGYITVNGKTEPVYFLSNKKGYLEAGKIVKEFGIPESIIDSNISKSIPGGTKYKAQGTQKLEDGSSKVTYDFSTFEELSFEHSVVTTPFSEEEDGVDLAPGELLEDYSQTTGRRMGDVDLNAVDIANILTKMGAKKTSKGSLQVDGQHYYLDYGKYTVMSKGDMEELFLYPEGKEGDNVLEISGGLRALNSKGSFVNTATTPVSKPKVDGLTQKKLDETKDDYKHCNLG
jgi:hypothetical protein